MQDVFLGLEVASNVATIITFVILICGMTR